MTSISHVSLLSVILGLCYGGLVAAQEPVRPVAIDLTTMSKTPRVEAVTALIAQHTPYKPGTYPLISGSDPSFTELLRWVYPARTDLTCAPDVFALDDRLEQARRLLIELELDRSVEILNGIYDTLPCLTAPVSRAQVHKIFYLEGTALYFAGDMAPSQRAFLEALAVDKESQPLEGFPPEVAEAYREAARVLSDVEVVRLEVDPTLRQAGLVIDGLPLPQEDYLKLSIGRHVAQVFDEQGVARTAAFVIESGESRPMKELIRVLPPGSASYLSALLRTALQNGELDATQLQALDSFARIKGYTMVFFAVVDTTSSTGQRLMFHRPGLGLMVGAPSDLPPLTATVATNPDPTPAATSGKKPGRKPAKGDERGPSTPVARQDTPKETRAASGRKAPTEPPADRPAEGRQGSTAGDGGRRAPRGDQVIVEEDGADSQDHVVVRLEVLSLSYHRDFFSQVLPTASIPIVGGLKLRAGLGYSSDFGARTGEPLSLIGVQLGPEYELTTGRFAARAGLGLDLTTSQVKVEESGRQVLLLEGTPLTWLGVDYVVSDAFRMGLGFGVGGSPGLVGEIGSHGLWFAGVSAAFVL